MLLRHPLFAFKLYLLVIDIGLGRFDGREGAPLSGSVTRRGAGTVGPTARQRTARRPGRRLPVVVKTQRQRTVLQTRLVRSQRVFRAASSNVVVKLGRQRRLTHVRLVRLQRICALVLIRLQAEARRPWLVLHTHLVGVPRTGGRARAGRVTRAGRARFVLNACVAQLGLQARAAAEGLVATLRKTELSLRGLRRPRIPWTATRALFRSRRPRAAGVLAGLALAAAAVATVVATHNLGSSDETGATAYGTLPSDQFVHKFFVLPPAPRATKRVERTAARTIHRAKPRVAQPMTFVSNTVQAAVPTAPDTSTTTAASSSTGPAPLPAPAGASAPAPLKAP